MRTFWVIGLISSLVLGPVAATAGPPQAASDRQENVPLVRDEPAGHRPPQRADTPRTRGFGSFRSGPTQEKVPGELIVGFRPGSTVEERAAALAEVGFNSRSHLGLPRMQVVDLGSRNIQEAAHQLRGQGPVKFVEPNYIYSLASVPNDTKFGQLWGLNNTGQTIEGIAGAADADIDAPEAWDIETGDASVKVAVVDSGVAVGHPDLAGNVTSGWDFIENDAVPQDENGHGTHVAGTIGASGNDGFGVTGVNWDVTIIPVRVFGKGRLTDTATIVSGMQYAVQQRADIVNLSLGGPSNSQAMRDVIAGAPEVLFVAAAGNGGEDRIGDNVDVHADYPCAYTSANLICVANTDQRDVLAGSSNFGTTSVDLAAPGSNILSNAPATATAFSDGFEGSPVPWSSGGTQPWDFEQDAEGFYATDSAYSNYQNNTDSWIDSNPFSTVGRSNCKLNYLLYLDTEFDRDGVLIQATTDGINYENVDGFTGWSETWVPLTTDISAYDGGPQVGISFRLVSDESVVGDGVLIDDVSVDCGSASFGPEDVAFKGGTSMAAPHVSGAAALLKAANPAATVAQVRSALLNGAEDKTTLSGKVATGGRLNLFNSVKLITSGGSPAPSPTAGPSPTPTSSPPAVVDTAAPILSYVTDRPDPFTPNGDGRQDRVKIYWDINERAYTQVKVFSAAGTLVRSFQASWIDPGSWYVPWNGRNRAGRLVRSGTYIYKITARDAAANVRANSGRVSVRR